MPLRYEVMVNMRGVDEVTGVLSSPRDALETGEAGFPVVQLAQNNAQGVWAHGESEIADSASLTIDLLNFESVFEASAAMHYVALIFIDVDAPDGVLTAKVGPQGVTAAFEGPWGDASDVSLVQDTMLLFNRWEAWQVDDDHKVFTIANNSGDPITVRYLIAGGYYTVPAPPVVSGTVTAGSGTLDITWTAPAGNALAPVKQYALYIDDGGGYALEDTVAASVLSYQFTGLAASLHSLKVRSVNQAGESIDSNVVTGTPNA